MKKSNKKSIFRLTLLSLFVAIMLVMNFTPIGYITTGAFSITLMTIPVALGAACMGPVGGIVLGIIFGLTSFLQAFNIGFMIDPLAATLFTENALGYTISCFAPRILAGVASGVIFWFFERKKRVNFFAYASSSAIIPLVNTSLFMTFFALFYQDTIFGGKSIMAIVLSAFTLNFLIEFIVTIIAGTVINKAIYTYSRRFFVK